MHFDNKIASVYVLCKQIFDLMLMYHVPKKKKKSRVIGPGPKIDYPYGFFDGAAAGNIGFCDSVEFYLFHQLLFGLWQEH